MPPIGTDRDAAPALREVVLLALLQGPAELAPVSSSAHVEAIPALLDWDFACLDGAIRKEVEVALHGGTALALLLARHERPSLAVAALTLAPAALAGVLLEAPIQEKLGTPRALAAGLVAGSVALVLADRAPARRQRSGHADALAVGLAQACALVPGISRSGATIAAGRACGLDRPAAARLSRQAALPVLVAATALKSFRLLQRRADPAALATLAVGAAAAAASTSAALLARGALARVPLGVWATERVALAVLLLRHNRAR
jgi:undecaprenyl-diphosphatase